MLDIAQDALKGLLETLEVVVVDVARGVDGPVNLAGVGWGWEGGERGKEASVRASSRHRTDITFPSALSSQPPVRS